MVATGLKRKATAMSLCRNIGFLDRAAGRIARQHRPTGGPHAMKKTTVLATALLAVLAGPAAAQTDRDGHQRWLDIENRSGMTIREAYMTDVDTPNWGDDRLGRDVVPPGNRYRMLPNARQRARGYCRYDVRLIWENGQAWERRSINLCEATALNCTGVGVCGVR
jgi:hypothetical protein